MEFNNGYWHLNEQEVRATGFPSVVSDTDFVAHALGTYREFAATEALLDEYEASNAELVRVHGRRERAGLSISREVMAAMELDYLAHHGAATDVFNGSATAELNTVS